MTAAADALTVATAYTARGWRTVPVPYREEGPRIRGWQKLRLDSGDDLAKHFNGKPSNVGVLLGEPSGGLVDVDLDASEARELAGDFLPPTAAVFGRPGNPASHWLYAPSPLLATAQFTDPTVKDRDDKRHMVVELRSTGLQTVFPGSTHVSGELITWAREGDPAKIAADVLTSSVRRLAAAALLGRHWPGEGGRHAATLC